MTEIQRAIDRLVDVHKSLRKAAAAIGVDHAYLHRLRAGRKTNPSDETLAKLGIEKRVTFRRRRNGA